MKNTHIAYGFVTALAMIIVNVILYITNASFTTWGRYVAYIPFLIGLILNALAFAKANDGYVTYGGVFTSGFKASAIVTIVTLAWSFIALYIVFPGMAEKGMEYARKSMEAKNLSEEQINAGIEMTRKYFTTFMVAGIIFGTMLAGLIFSLIAAAIPKKKGVTPFDNAAQ